MDRRKDDESGKAINVILVMTGGVNTATWSLDLMSLSGTRSHLVWSATFPSWHQWKMDGIVCFSPVVSQPWTQEELFSSVGLCQIKSKKVSFNSVSLSFLSGETQLLQANMTVDSWSWLQHYLVPSLTPGSSEHVLALNSDLRVYQSFGIFVKPCYALVPLALLSRWRFLVFMNPGKFPWQHDTLFREVSYTHPHLETAARSAAQGQLSGGNAFSRRSQASFCNLQTSLTTNIAVCYHCDKKQTTCKTTVR